MHQSTTPSLTQTIWPRWVSRQFLSLPIGQTLLPVTFCYSLSSEAVVVKTIEEMKEAVTKVIDTLTQEDFHGAFQKLLEEYNKCIETRGDYFQGVGTINKSAHTKKSGNLSYTPRISPISQQNSSMRPSSSDFKLYPTFSNQLPKIYVHFHNKKKKKLMKPDIFNFNPPSFFPPHLYLLHHLIICF